MVFFVNKLYPLFNIILSKTGSAEISMYRFDNQKSESLYPALGKDQMPTLTSRKTTPTPFASFPLFLFAFIYLRSRK
jgi:hypothetical protein